MADIYDRAGSIDPGAGAQRPILPEGFYPKLVVEKCVSYDGKNPKRKGAHFFRADIYVLTPANGVKEGYGSCFLEQIAGNQFPDHDDRGLGSVKAFGGAALGLEGKEAINNAVTPAVMRGFSAGDGTALTGHVFAARVSHVRTANTTIAKLECFPVLGPDGKPEVVAVKSAKTEDAPPPPPPPPGDSIPAGWKVHPNAPEWIYEIANPKNMKKR